MTQRCHLSSFPEVPPLRRNCLCLQRHPGPGSNRSRGSNRALIPPTAPRTNGLSHHVDSRAGLRSETTNCQVVAILSDSYLIPFFWISRCCLVPSNSK